MVDKVSITAPDPNIIPDFLSLNRKNSYLGDMLLVCEDGEVKANQSVVVANCKLFRNILRDQPHCSSYQPVIYLADQTIRNVSYLLQNPIYKLYAFNFLLRELLSPVSREGLI